MPENPRFSCADNGFLFEKSSLENNVYDILAFCPRDIQLIGSNAFAYSSIKRFAVPSQLIEIGIDSFAECKELEFFFKCKMIQNLKRFVKNHSIKHQLNASKFLQMLKLSRNLLLVSVKNFSNKNNSSRSFC